MHLGARTAQQRERAGSGWGGGLQSTFVAGAARVGCNLGEVTEAVLADADADVWLGVYCQLVKVRQTLVSESDLRRLRGYSREAHACFPRRSRT